MPSKHLNLYDDARPASRPVRWDTRPIAQARPLGGDKKLPILETDPTLLEDSPHVTRSVSKSAHDAYVERTSAPLVQKDRAALLEEVLGSINQQPQTDSEFDFE